jgi:hypothetical protein
MHERVGPRHLWLLIVVIIAVFASFTRFVWLKHIDYRKVDITLNSESVPHTPQEQNTSLNGTSVVTYPGVPGENALELLEKKESPVTIKESPSGPYVDGIKDKEGGENGKYWTLYINGQLSQTGAKDYITKRGDKIEWKFE